MKKLTSLLLYSGLAAAVTAGVAACDKDEPLAADTEIGRRAAEESLLASAAFSSAFASVEANAQQSGTLVLGLEIEDGGFGTETTDRSSETPWTCKPGRNFETTQETFYPATLTLNYGSAGCAGTDGRELAGRLTAVFSAPIHVENSTIDISFDDFSVDGYEIDGDYHVVKLGDGADGAPAYLHTVQEATILKPDGDTFGYEALTETRLVAGATTNYFTSGEAGIADDVWAETHQASLTTPEGTYRLNSTAPTRRPVTCGYPVEGGYSISGGQLAGEAELFYGDGNCDREALVTYGGVDYQVRLR